MKPSLTKFLFLLVLGLLVHGQAVFAQRVILAGAADSIKGLPSAEQKAYSWALTQFGADAAYMSFMDIRNNGLPKSARVVWFHFEDDPALPAIADSAAATIGQFVNNGGGLLASSFATDFLVKAGVTTVSPTETIDKDPAGPDVAWGVRPLNGKASHPVFAGMTATTDWVDPNWGGYRTVSATTSGREAIRWWTGGKFPGTPIACMPWWNPADPNIPVIGEMTKGNGRAMACSAPGYNWVNSDTNGATEQANLRMLTANMLKYLQASTELILVGEPLVYDSLALSEKNAYDWAFQKYGFAAQYRSFAQVASAGIENTVKTVWFHLEDVPAIPASAASAAMVIGDFVKTGGGLFASTFATKYIFDIGASSVAPTETIDKDPAGPDVAWGVKPLAGKENHPFFAGMTATTDWVDPNWGGFRTIGAATAGHEAIRWWTGGAFPGTPVACMPWWNPADPNIPILGTLKYGLGTVAFASGPGYQWLPAKINDATSQSNLEKLTENILKFARPAASIVLVGNAATVDSLPTGEKNAYNWVLSTYSGAQYRTFAQIASDGIPAETEVIWYHLEDGPEFPASANAAAAKIDTFVHKGGGLLLSSFATGYATKVNATSVAPTETIDKDPAGPDVAWGVRPLTGLASHSFFAGMSPTTDWVDPNWGGFRTIGASVQGREAIRWWTGGAYPGQPIACMPWWNPNDPNIPVIGFISAGDGGVATCSAPGYHWVNSTVNEASPKANLEKLTANMLEFLRRVDETQSLQVTLASGGKTIKEAEESGKVIQLEVSNATFKAALTPANWTLLNLPSGLTATIARVDEKHATITLGGTAADYDVDVTDFTIRIPASEFIDLRTDSLKSVGDIIFDGFVEQVQIAGKIALVGTEATIYDLDPDEKAAYAWAIAKFDTNAVYFNVVDLVLDPTLLNGFKSMWWHYDKFVDLPLLFDNPNTIAMVKAFRQKGGGILLTGAASQYVKHIGATTKGPNEVKKAATPFTNPDHWGIRAKDSNHPIFLNLPVPFFTLYSQNGLREDMISWWNLVPDFDLNTPPAQRFDGVYLGTTEWDANFQFIISVAEFPGTESPCTGDVLAVGAGAFDWYLDGGTNEDRPNLELFTSNMLNYLKGGCVTPVFEPVRVDLPTFAYPNPASEFVNISFSLENKSDVVLEIFDLSGRKIANVLTQAEMPSGAQVLQWQVNRQPSGVYFYRIKAGEKTGMGKFVLSKE